VTAYSAVRRSPHFVVAGYRDVPRTGAPRTRSGSIARNRTGRLALGGKACLRRGHATGGAVQAAPGAGFLARPSAGRARSGLAVWTEEVFGVDRPPRARCAGVRGEDQKFVVTFDADPRHHNR
jgi:hypothetical protein